MVRQHELKQTEKAEFGSAGHMHKQSALPCMMDDVISGDAEQLVCCDENGMAVIAAAAAENPQELSMIIRVPAACHAMSFHKFVTLDDFWYQSPVPILRKSGVFS